MTAIQVNVYGVGVEFRPVFDSLVFGWALCRTEGCSRRAFQVHGWRWRWRIGIMDCHSSFAEINEAGRRRIGGATETHQSTGFAGRLSIDHIEFHSRRCLRHSSSPTTRLNPLSSTGSRPSTTGARNRTSS